jgi:hypothetical protein
VQDQDINYVCSAVSKGAKVFIGRNHLGKSKIKLTRGPFGLWVQRYEASFEQAEKLKHHLSIKSWAHQNQHLKFKPKANSFHRA